MTQSGMFEISNSDIFCQSGIFSHVLFMFSVSVQRSSDMGIRIHLIGFKLRPEIRTAALNIGATKRRYSKHLSAMPMSSAHARVMPLPFDRSASSKACRMHRIAKSFCCDFRSLVHYQTFFGQRPIVFRHRKVPVNVACILLYMLRVYPLTPRLTSCVPDIPMCDD